MQEGVISNKWQEEPKKYWKTYKSMKSSKQWTMELIKHLILTAWNMWQHQNKALHDTEENHHVILEDEVNRRITTLYTRGPDAFSNSTTTLFEWSEADLIQIPLAYKTQCVATAIIAQAICNRQKAGPYSNECQCMQTWVIWNNTNNAN